MWRQWNAYPDKLVKVVSTTAGDTLFSRLSTALTITIIYNVTRATVSCDHIVVVNIYLRVIVIIHVVLA